MRRVVSAAFDKAAADEAKRETLDRQEWLSLASRIPNDMRRNVLVAIGEAVSKKSENRSLDCRRGPKVEKWAADALAGATAGKVVLAHFALDPHEWELWIDELMERYPLQRKSARR